MNPRPKRNDPKVIEILKGKVVEALLKWSEGNYQNDWEEISGRVAERLLIDITGYDVAKYMDDVLNVLDVDSRLVELMDDLIFSVCSIHEEVLKEWVKSENLTCPFSLNEDVTFKSENQMYIGKVVRIKPETGKIVVFCPELGHGKRDSSGAIRNGRILPYEECLPCRNIQ